MCPAVDGGERVCGVQFGWLCNAPPKQPLCWAILCMLCNVCVAWFGKAMQILHAIILNETHLSISISKSCAAILEHNWMHCLHASILTAVFTKNLSRDLTFKSGSKRKHYHSICVA